MYNMFCNELNHISMCHILEGNCFGIFGEISSSHNYKSNVHLMKKSESCQ
jgi:hypothetical protein